MFHRIILLLALATSSAIFLGCTAASPQWRITQNTSIYESLSDDHQKLASKGRIAKGMTEPAVYLALGNPARKIRGYRSDAPYERWEYSRMQPHMHHSFYAYQGLGLGRHGGSYGGFGLAPSIHYIPSQSASVTFRNGVVDSWEFSSPQPSAH